MIMDLACDKPKHVLSDADINKIHYCRSYLQIHQLSYMCTADGGRHLTHNLDGITNIMNILKEETELLSQRFTPMRWLKRPTQYLDVIL